MFTCRISTARWSPQPSTDLLRNIALSIVHCHRGIAHYKSGCSVYLEARLVNGLISWCCYWPRGRQALGRGGESNHESKVNRALYVSVYTSKTT
eukprot:6175562-Pleurochrysis_carterae.AAC.1